MTKEARDWRAFALSPLAVLAIWALYAALRLVAQPLLGWEPIGADDWTRALEVRALIDGQGWWDVSQHRMNPPEGYTMHWSRLVDLPLAGASLVLGEGAAFALVPLLWLLPALLALRAIMRRLGLAPAALGAGLALFALFPLLPGTYAPFAIDHHGAQAAIGLAAAAFALHDTRKTALAAGACAAAWLAISLEGLPLVALLGGLYAWRYLAGGERLLAWFLGALAAMAAALSLATRPLAELTGPFCDILRLDHAALFLAAAVAAAALPYLPRQDRAGGRLAALAAIGGALGVLALALLGRCLVDPMGALDPLLQTYWYDQIREGLPIWRQAFSVAVMLAWTPLLVVAGWWLARRGEKAAPQDRAVAWDGLAALALGACLYSFAVMRVGVIAQFLAIPFAAILLARLWPRARAIQSSAPRIAATLAVIGLSTPLFASAFAKPFDPIVGLADAPEGAGLAGPCAYSRLTALAPGLVFATLDAGPEILGKTRHSVLGASYHRNQRPMRAVIAIYGGPVDAARGRLRALDVDYVIACAAEPDLALYRSMAPDSFANALLGKAVPGWLEPVAGFESGALRVYRLR